MVWIFLFQNYSWASEMAQQVKVLMVKSDYLGLVPKDSGGRKNESIPGSCPLTSVMCAMTGPLSPK